MGARDRVCRRLRVVTLALAAFAPATQAQVRADSAAAIPATVARADTVGAGRRLPSPGGALRRSLLLPGWGQAYAGRPARTPVVVAVLGGLGTAAVVLNGRYLHHRRAAFFQGCVDTPDREVCAGTDDEAGQDEYLEGGYVSAADARSRRDAARRNRDLAVLGTALAYALQALDAYVAAQLADFDVGEDLSLHAVPAPDGAAVALRVRF